MSRKSRILSDIRHYKNQKNKYLNELNEKKKILQDVETFHDKFVEMESDFNNTIMERQSRVKTSPIPKEKVRSFRTYTDNIQDDLFGTRIYAQEENLQNNKMLIVNKISELEYEIDDLNTKIIQCENRISDLEYELLQLEADEDND